MLALAAWLGLTPLLKRPPDLYGLATWYGPPAFRDGDIMRNGEPLDLAGATVAVDTSHWPRWADRSAIVLTECGTLHRVKITDTGRLYEVGGWLRLGVRQGRLRYWPVLENAGPGDAEPVLLTPITERDIEWREDAAYRVVADFPMKWYARVAACRVDHWGEGDTQKVMIWVLGDAGR